MRYLLDTNAFSRLLKEDADFMRYLGSLDRQSHLVICSIVRGEVLYGLERMPEGRKKKGLAEKIGQLLASLPCETVPPSAADHYGRIKRHAEMQGRSMAENDLWIAATALALDAVLVSADRDFGAVSDLKVETGNK